VLFGHGDGFAATFALRSLLPALGGDGSRGFILKGIDANDLSGWSVSDAGDVNGDGVGDVIVGAPRADSGGQLQPGECYVVFGRTTGFPAAFELRGLHPAAGGDGSEGFIMQGIEPNGAIARSVGGAGDVNGDGLDDVLIGSSNALRPPGRGQRSELRAGRQHAVPRAHDEHAIGVRPRLGEESGA
jgi:hypothetical protein